MAATMGKRKAMQDLESSTKRLRIDKSISHSQDPAIQPEDNDKDGNENYQEYSVSSDDGDYAADTLATSISPGRKKFPSELNTINCTWEGCDKTFNRPARLATHLNFHRNERPFNCTHEGCDKAYMDKKHLNAHIKASHENERTFVCDWEGCGKTFNTGTRLRRHKEIHEGENRHRCTGYDGCNQTFRKHNTLERHIRSEHLGLAPFECTFIDIDTGIQCGQGFDGAVGLKKHEQGVHLTVPQFFCLQCTIPGFFNPDGSPKHLAFKTDAKLQSHIKNAHIHCPFCELKIGSKHSLEKHIESQHSGISLEERKIIPCPFDGCDKSFTKESNLKTHVSSVHDGVRYICGTFDVSNAEDLFLWDGSDGCGKDYVNKANLENHVRTFHLGLPDKNNASRRKEVEYDEDGNEIRKKGGIPPYKPSIIDEILGTAYEKDPRRKIPCIFPDCPYKFIRQYDLQVHLGAKCHHNLDAAEVDDLMQGNFPEYESISGKTSRNAFSGNELDFGGDGAFDVPIYNENKNTGGFTAPTFGQGGTLGSLDTPEVSFSLGEMGDPEWSMDKFWVGADDGERSGEGEDDFQIDEIEMRRLIDEAEHPDPALEGF